MKRILLLLMLSGFAISSINAQEVETKTKYSVSGGILGAANFSKFRIPDNDGTITDYNYKTSWAAGAWVNFPIGTVFSIEPQVMYSTYEYHTKSLTPMLLNDGKLRYISVPVLLKLNAGKYLAITAGPQVDFLVSVGGNNTTAPESDFSQTSFALNGGLELFPRGPVTIFGRYIYGLTDMDNRDAHGPVELKNEVIQAGIKIKLFGKKSKSYRATSTTVTTVVLDRDGDGINDNLDKCPDVAGLAKYDGCPIPDTDGDGVNDELDKCPNVAGLAKYEGCPIPDSDGDGINDELDKCPNTAGPAKYDGCPIPDRDNDGINDEEDKCPDIAGIAANNGCPEVPANVSKTLGSSARNISFGAANATLTTRSNTSLNQIVTVMNENPGLKVNVEGHTDNVGNDDKNMQLSKDRAEAVKTYLVSKGISEDRITTEGFGETMPIADNNTSTGRMKNRRIEIRIVY